MDNCMFQIETALLKFDGLSGSEDDKTSVVKRYASTSTSILNSRA
jgi:ubiquitin carboxyl-terminal hydrolase 25